MSDINAAPSSTEPSNEAAETDMQEGGAATVGEASAVQAAAELTPVNVTGSVDALPNQTANGAALDGGDPNAGASPAAGQSASDTASSAQGASQDAGTEVAALRADVEKWRAAYNDAAEQIAALRGRIEVLSLGKREHPAKPHLSALLTKLESGEAIVLADLHAKLRAVVEAL